MWTSSFENLGESMPFQLINDEYTRFTISAASENLKLMEFYVIKRVQYVLNTIYPYWEWLRKWLVMILVHYVCTWDIGRNYKLWYELWINPPGITSSAKKHLKFTWDWIECRHDILESIMISSNNVRSNWHGNLLPKFRPPQIVHNHKGGITLGYWNCLKLETLNATAQNKDYTEQ